MRLNSYLRFLILLYENSQSEYFYSSDFKVFIDILLREMEMNRSGKSSLMQSSTSTSS